MSDKLCQPTRILPSGPTVHVQLRPKPRSCPIVVVDVRRDTGTLVEYSYDGRAYAEEFVDVPAILEGTPCQSHVRRLLLRNGIEVAEASGRHEEGLTVDSRRPGRETTRRVCEDLTLERDPGGTGDEDSAVINFRAGSPSYSHDVIGDGTVVLVYSYEGSALWALVNVSLPVPTRWLPCTRAIDQLLVRQGRPIADDGNAALLRPWLRSLDTSSGRATVWLTTRSQGRRSEQDIHGDGTVTVGYTADAVPIYVSLAKLHHGVNLRGVPHRDRVAAIVNHQGFRVIDTDA